MPRKTALPGDDIPGVGLDDSEQLADGGVVLMRTPAGAAFVPKSLSKALGNPQVAELVALLQAHVMAMQDLRQEVEHVVYALRDAGASWTVVGWCVGTSSEAARQRWSERERA